MTEFTAVLVVEHEEGFEVDEDTLGRELFSILEELPGIALDGLGGRVSYYAVNLMSLKVAP